MSLESLTHLYRTDAFYRAVVDALASLGTRGLPDRRFYSLVSTEFWALQLCFIARDDVSVMLMDPTTMRKTDTGWAYSSNATGIEVPFLEGDVLVLRQEDPVDLTLIRDEERLQELDTTLFQQQIPLIQEFIGDREPWPR